ncbi:MAG: VOC family protein [Microthrixaceae bacterium]|nr:VOC family protein [Microthrixaceae bacterium]
MATVTEHPAGVPSWTDLATPDPEAAKAFYGELFGWSYESNPTGTPGNDYIMANKGDSAAAGIMLLSEEMAASGMPPVWSTYVTVTDIEATAKKAEAAGGTVLQAPMEVMQAGRMAVLSDPAGAVICAWQPLEHIGAEVINEHGAFTWAELMTPDPAAVEGFYAEVFGWSANTSPMPDVDYTVFNVEGGNPDGVAGAMKPPMDGMPAFWGVYFAVDDAAATAERATELGATLMMEPTAMPGVGTLAAISDPQGAMFSIMTPEG